MTLLPRLFFLSVFYLTSWVSLVADAPWVSVVVPTSEVESTQEQFRLQGIESLSWADAVTEVSAFEGLETVRVSELASRLTPGDPRWDPWLRSLSSWFEPEGGRSRIWVPVGNQPLSTGTPPSDTPPAAITGAVVLFLTVFFVILRVLSWVLAGRPSIRLWRSWAWIPVSLVLMAGGATLVLRATGSGRGPAAVSTVSWIQHRWFQETWPWGARWDDWAPGKVWTYPTYEQRSGRVVEGLARLGAGGDSWSQTAWESLDRKNAARIFGFHNP